MGRGQKHPSRIVVVSSKLHEQGTVDLDDLHFSKGRPFTVFKGYAQSKLANVLGAKEIARRFATLLHSSVTPFPKTQCNFFNTLERGGAGCRAAQCQCTAYIQGSSVWPFVKTPAFFSTDWRGAVRIGGQPSVSVQPYIQGHLLGLF
jgi:hypothetical protein